MKPMKDFFKIVGAVVLGTCLVGGIVVILLMGSLSSLVMGLGGRAVPTAVPHNAVLVVNFESGVANQDSQNPLASIIPSQLGSISSGTGFYNMIRAIDFAAQDPRVQMIYMNPQYMDAQMSHVEELRNALLRFRQSGKPVISYADTYSQQGYYIASAADKILLQPLGVVEMKGFGMNVLYFKDLFDKYGVEAQVVRHGSYKSGGENFTRPDMSAQERQQMSDYLQTAWQHWAIQIENARHLPAGTADHIANARFFSLAHEALQDGLIDQIADKEALAQYLCTLSQVPTERALPLMLLEDYMAANEAALNPHTKDKIALMYATGDISVGKGLDDQAVLSDNFAAQLRAYRADSTIKAIVIRIDSPGGDPVGADIIAREMALTKAQKPVIVSMGDMAASAAYWIAADATTVFANPNTLTGSIGVFSLYFNGEKALKDVLHINNQYIDTHTASHFPSYYIRLNDTQLDVLRHSVDSTYQVFIAHVAQGRGMAVDSVDRMAQGHVWAGRQAAENHLVDYLGGLTDALAAAADMAHLATYSLVEYPQPLSFLNKLTALGGFGAMSGFGATDGFGATTTTKPATNDILTDNAIVRRFQAQQGTKARLPFVEIVY